MQVSKASNILTIMRTNSHLNAIMMLSLILSLRLEPQSVDCRFLKSAKVLERTNIHGQLTAVSSEWIQAEEKKSGRVTKRDANSQTSKLNSASHQFDSSAQISQQQQHQHSNSLGVKNVTAQNGQSVILHCVVEPSDGGILNNDLSVSWFRGTGELQLLTYESNTIIQDERFVVRHGPLVKDDNDWALQIKNLDKTTDSGLYQCQTNSDPPQSQYYQLSIVEPQVHIMGSPDLAVKVGAPINLTCVISQTADQMQFVFWYRDNKMINYDLDEQRGKFLLSKWPQKQDTITSNLIIFQSKQSDSGNYTCMPSGARSVSIQVFVLEGSDRRLSMYQREAAYDPTAVSSQLTNSAISVHVVRLSRGRAYAFFVAFIVFATWFQLLAQTQTAISLLLLAIIGFFLGKVTDNEKRNSNQANYYSHQEDDLEGLRRFLCRKTTPSDGEKGQEETNTTTKSNERKKQQSKKKDLLIGDTSPSSSSSPPSTSSASPPTSSSYANTTNISHLFEVSTLPAQQQQQHKTTSTGVAQIDHLSKRAISAFELFSGLSSSASLASSSGEADDDDEEEEDHQHRHHHHHHTHLGNCKRKFIHGAECELFKLEQTHSPLVSPSAQSSSSSASTGYNSAEYAVVTATKNNNSLELQKRGLEAVAENNSNSNSNSMRGNQIKAQQPRLAGNNHHNNNEFDAHKEHDEEGEGEEEEMIELVGQPTALRLIMDKFSQYTGLLPETVEPSPLITTTCAGSATLSHLEQAASPACAPLKPSRVCPEQGQASSFSKLMERQECNCGTSKRGKSKQEKPPPVVANERAEQEQEGELSLLPLVFGPGLE